MGLFAKVALLATVGISSPRFVAPTVAAAEVVPASRPDVAQALLRARDVLLASIPTASREHGALLAYAAFKTGVEKEHPLVQGMIDRVAGYCRDDRYRVAGSNHDVYVCGIEAMLLSDTGGATYRKELSVIRDFLVERQNPNGSWYYSQSAKNSDLSVTQYAVLGLWAAERAGATVEPVVWAKAAQFLLAADRNGGFPYRAEGNGRAEMSMTAAGLASLAICRKHLAGGFAPARPSRTTQQSSEGIRYQILRPVVIEAEEEAVESKSTPIPADLRVSRADIDAGIRRSAEWLDKRFNVVNDKPGHLSYWYYTLERAGALAGREKFGDAVWYDVCADALLPQQGANGQWNMNNYTVSVDTAFIALFLARPTLKLAGRTVTPTFGGGLLSGGRGLPTNLDDFGKPIVEQRVETPLESLLREISSANATRLPKLQKQLVDTIQVADREALVGQYETLIKLVEHPSTEVRRTALWAMGRTGDLRLARYPIAALDDNDPAVLTEARNALAWIARRPESFGHPEDPLATVPPGASLEAKKRAIESWRSAMLRDWGRWYLDASPYAERFDEFELDLRARLRKL